MHHKDMKRAIRRGHISRLKYNRRNYWGYYRKPWGTETWVTMSPKALGSVVQHPQSCSCPGCGNIRRYVGNSAVGLTQQELSHREIERLDLAALGSDDESLGTQEEAESRPESE